MIKRSLITLLLFTTLVATQASARLTELQIKYREPVANGIEFGAAGAYEKIIGTAKFQVEPSHTRNRNIADITRAENKNGENVEFSADFMILQPADPKKNSGVLYLEAPNQGNKLILSLLQDASSKTSLNNPQTAEDFGNGFLMNRGHTIVWVGWQANVKPIDGRMTVNFPLAMSEGASIKELILTELNDRSFGDSNPNTVPLSGRDFIESFPSVSADKKEAGAQLFALNSDSRDEPSPEVARGEPVPEDQWQFSDCSNGWPGTPSTKHICMKNGFLKNKNYHLIYRAENSPVMGLGLATTRDLISFIRNQGQDDLGNRNPVIGVRNTMCVGIGQAAAYLRDFLYQGFNVDEDNRKVCDGMNIHGAGVTKSFLNYRFGQPYRESMQHSERFIPSTNFPRQYSVRVNPFLRFPDGILKRPVYDPLIFHTDTSTDYWQHQASLVGSSEGGSMDFTESNRVRRFFLAGSQRMTFANADATQGIGERQCINKTSTVHNGPLMRGLISKLENWVVEGTEPPESQYPRIAEKELVDPKDIRFPFSGGMVRNDTVNISGDMDFGPRVKFNRGAIDLLVPVVMAGHNVLVPNIDEVGNEVGGIRHPLVEAATNTYLGFNIRQGEFGRGELCDDLGSAIPLASTPAERDDSDHRPALNELYESSTVYLQAVEKATKLLSERGLLLEADARIIKNEAANIALELWGN